MKTTLNKIREHDPCRTGWEKLLKHLGKTKADNEPLSLLTILESNGLDDTIWCLCAVDGYEKEMRLFAVWCARQVQHLMKDRRSIEALDVVERYAHGLVTHKYLEAAWAAVRGTESDAVLDEVRAAASASARNKPSDEAWVGAKDAARRETSDAARAKQQTEFKQILEELECV